MAAKAQKEDVKFEDKQKALDAALSQIEKQFGKGAVMKLGDNNAKMAVEVVPTGSLSLDLALGVGGLPKGRIVEVYGPESSGKTTVALHMVAEVQKRGGIAGYVDAEHAMDPTYAKALGVDIDNLYISQPDDGEQALEITETMVRSGAIDIVIVLICLAMLFGVQMIINKTRLGLAIRAASHDLDSASLMGVNVQQLLTIVFVLAGAMAGMAGVMTATKYQAYPALAANMTNKSFIAAVVGGLGSLEGAVIGSFVLAMGEVMISGYVSSELRDLFSYGLLIAILLIRPRGIMGKRFDDKA